MAIHHLTGRPGTRDDALEAAATAQRLDMELYGAEPVKKIRPEFVVGDIGCYGSPVNKTPALDKLASEGIRFTDFYAACAVCSPSRAAFMTGRFSVRAGVYSWIHTSHKMHLRRDEATIAELLKGAGYATAHVGKWHLGYDLEEGSGDGPTPADQEFD